jgi:hypothetical protein
LSFVMFPCDRKRRILCLTRARAGRSTWQDPSQVGNPLHKGLHLIPMGVTEA